MAICALEVNAGVPPDNFGVGETLTLEEGQVIPFMTPNTKLSRNIFLQLHTSAESFVFPVGCLAPLLLTLAVAKMFAGATCGGQTASVTGLDCLAVVAGNKK